jgi:tRNA-Thr(GGU) m(6)t(6)A37 methyltransferase TsaA
MFSLLLFIPGTTPRVYAARLDYHRAMTTSDERFTVTPIGHVMAARAEPTDDRWGETAASIVLAPRFGPDALLGLDTFSHVEVLFLFDRVDPDRVETGARHPRGDTARPRVGIFAQRGKRRPNRIGSTIARIVEVRGTTLVVAELDAIDGTPILDLKPVMREFLPRGELRQPAWVAPLMAAYWRAADD